MLYRRDSQNNEDKLKKPTLGSHSISVNYCNILAQFRIMHNKFKATLTILSRCESHLQTCSYKKTSIHWSCMGCTSNRGQQICAMCTSSHPHLVLYTVVTFIFSYFGLISHLGLFHTRLWWKWLTFDLPFKRHIAESMLYHHCHLEANSM